MLGPFRTRDSLQVAWVASAALAGIMFFIRPVYAQKPGLGADSPCIISISKLFMLVFFVSILFLALAGFLLFGATLDQSNNDTPDKISTVSAVDAVPASVPYGYVMGFCMFGSVLIKLITIGLVFSSRTYRNGDECYIQQKFWYLTKFGIGFYGLLLTVMFFMSNIVTDYTGRTAMGKIGEDSKSKLVKTFSVKNTGIISETIDEVSDVTEVSISDEQRKTIMQNVLDSF